MKMGKDYITFFNFNPTVQKSASKRLPMLESVKIDCKIPTMVADYVLLQFPALSGVSVK